jgi:hypothetical protein
LLTGCYAKGHLYPVQGPLAAEVPLPILPATATGIFNSGSLTVTLPGGERCKGAWKMVNRKSNSGPQASAQPYVDLASAWDTVYGAGFYTAHILGTRLHVHAALTGDKGSVLHVEIYRPDTTNEPVEIKGVAKDDKGNIYKVVL